MQHTLANSCFFLNYTSKRIFIKYIPKFFLKNILTFFRNNIINQNIKNNFNQQNINMETRKNNESDGKPNLSNNLPYDKSTDSSQTTINTNDATYASQLSLENPAGFSRDAFGRQSMSEKRHATLDAKSTDTYQRSKKIREERDKLKKEGK